MRAGLIFQARAAAIILGLLASGCFVPPPPTREMDSMRALIAAELAVGDSAEEITTFFQRHDFAHAWDPTGEQYWDSFRKRYMGARSVRPYTDIYVYIYVDEERRFLRSEVDYIYRGLP